MPLVFVLLTPSRLPEKAEEVCRSYNSWEGLADSKLDTGKGHEAGMLQVDFEIVRKPIESKPIERNGAFKLIIYLFFHPACLWSFRGDLFCFKNHSNFHRFHFLFISFLPHLRFLRIVVLPWFPSVSFFVPFCFALGLIFQVRLSHYSPFIPPLLQISPSFLSTPFISLFSFPFVSASALIYKAHGFQVSASHQLSLIIQLRCQPAFLKSADKG